MAHRDDREAAHHRADALERELREARSELAQLKGQAPAAPPKRGGVGIFVALGAIVVLVGGAMTVLVLTAQRQAAREARLERSRGAHAQAREAEEAARAMRERAEALARARALEPPAPHDAPLPALAPHEVVWRGTLDASSLAGLREGDACTLSGDFSGTGDATRVHALTVRCGVVEVYRALFAPPRPATGLREGPVFGTAQRVYLFSFDDRAPSGASVSVSSTRHELRVTGAAGEGGITSIHLQDVSDAREGEGLGRPTTRRSPAFAGVIDRAMRAARVTGTAPVRAGERCAVSVRPVWEYPESCRIAVRCGRTWLYGAGEAGYLTCEVRDGRAVGARDDNPTASGGDPRLSWSGRAWTVSDYSEAGEWSVTLAP